MILLLSVASDCAAQLLSNYWHGALAVLQRRNTGIHAAQLSGRRTIHTNLSCNLKHADVDFDDIAGKLENLSFNFIKIRDEKWWTLTYTPYWGLSGKNVL